MKQNVHPPETYDFRQYDRLWQRVAPGLEPYPPEPAAPAAAGASQAASAGQADAGAQGVTPAQLGRDAQLPGAQADPCCMGSAAAEMLQVLTGFVEETLEDQRQLQALSRQAPSWARQRLRELAAEEGGRAKQLLAAYYLITGTCYRPNIVCQPARALSWCAGLRERYHAAACNGLNYARAAEGTTDLCLARLLRDLSDGEYRQAEALMALLERSLRL